MFSMLNLFENKLSSLAILALLFCWTGQSFAQDLEPRRWTQMPTGLNFVGVGIGHIEGDIFFDPVLLVKEATLDMEAAGFYEIALKFSTVELVQCIKIVSDNEISCIDNINPKRVNQWLSDKITEIDRVLNLLLKLRLVIAHTELKDYQEIIDQTLIY